MRTLSILLAALTLAAGPTSAAAEPAPPAASTPRAGAPARQSARRKVPVKTYSFTGDSLDGTRLRPDGSTLFGLRGARHSSLIQLRADFLREITRTAERLP